MYLVIILLGRTIFFGLSGLAALCILAGLYKIVRFLHISTSWATWIAGSLFILASVGLCLSILFPRQLGFFSITDIIGVSSFFIAIFAAGQWISRQWYVFIKKRTKDRFVSISREMLLFLRKHHQFLGWLVVITAVAHMLYFLPILRQSDQVEVITGFVALGILVLSIFFGVWLWIDRSLRRRRVSQRIQTIHSLLTIAFLVALIAHM